MAESKYVYEVNLGYNAKFFFATYPEVEKFQKLMQNCIGGDPFDSERNMSVRRVDPKFHVWQKTPDSLKNFYDHSIEKWVEGGMVTPKVVKAWEELDYSVKRENWEHNFGKFQENWTPA